MKRADACRSLAAKQNELEDCIRDHKLRIRHGYARSGYENETYRLTSEVDTLDGKIEHLDSALSSRNDSLKSALKAPLPVIQPLPRDENNAMPIIFFLYMPPVFQLLSRFSLTAQQLLIPKPWNSVWGGPEGTNKSDISSLVTRHDNTYRQLSLRDHYKSRQDSTYHKPSRKRVGNDYHLSLRSNDCIPKEIGSSSVDHIDNKNDGIWYPDTLRLVSYANSVFSSYLSLRPTFFSSGLEWLGLVDQRPSTKHPMALKLTLLQSLVIPIASPTSLIDFQKTMHSYSGFCNSLETGISIKIVVISRTPCKTKNQTGSPRQNGSHLQT